MLVAVQYYIAEVIYVAPVREYLQFDNLTLTRAEHHEILRFTEMFGWRQQVAVNADGRQISLALHQMYNICSPDAVLGKNHSK